jgi:diaminopimelate epimerase
MKISFTKMQGLGNDFVVIDGIKHPDIKLNTTQIKKLADRHFGIGFDQLLWILPTKDDHADFIFRIFNADGSEVGQCGNGARCVARYVYDHQLTSKNSIKLATQTTLIQAHIETDQQVSVDMGIPQFEGSQSFPLANQRIEATLVDLGNPHAVIKVVDVNQAPVQELGGLLQKHHHFPNGVNVGFMQILDKQHIKLRVFERGAGETLACGSGACAAMVAGYKQNLLDKEVRVDLPGGQLLISWEGPNTAVKMTGPAEVVFTGECDLQYV